MMLDYRTDLFQQYGLTVPKTWDDFANDAKMVLFYHAEDGIRDGPVTGVQTCALPICTICSIATPAAGWCLPTITSSSISLVPSSFRRKMRVTQIGRASCRERG